MALKFDTYLAIGIGGFIGAIGRAYTTHLANTLFKSPFPWGTSIVNLTGSFILGVLVALISLKLVNNPFLKSLFTTGMMGAFTTYSTFAVESFFLLDSGKWERAVGFILLNLIGTIVLAGLGFKTTLTLLGGGR